MRWLLLVLLLPSCSIFELESFSIEYPAPSHLVGKIESFSKENNRFAVILGGNVEERHRGNISLAYQVLIESGYKPENVFILDGDGSDTPNYPLTDILTKDSLEKLFWFLSKTLTETDELVVYLTGHGERIENNSFFKLNRNERLSKEGFLSLIKKIKIGRGFLMSDICYWAAPRDDEMKKWVILSVSRDDTVSYGNSFPRLFWWSFRVLPKPVSIGDAFSYSIRNDRGTTIKKINHPDLFWLDFRPECYTMDGTKTKNIGSCP